jgi:Fe-Mn family superoxide dismutase
LEAITKIPNFPPQNTVFTLFTFLVTFVNLYGVSGLLFQVFYPFLNFIENVASSAPHLKGGRTIKSFVYNRRQFLTLSSIGGIALLIDQPKIIFAQTGKEEKMAYTAKDYGKLLGMVGFSETLLKNHFTLYQGYVTNTNKLIEAFDQMLKEAKVGTPEYAELKRRFGWEFNGMRLHEYYFENLGGKEGLDKAAKLSKKISEDFGSYDAWEKDFKATGAMRGIGWTILYQDNLSGKLFNCWINEHDVGHPAGCTPILILDVFEHAFMIDYGLKRADYIAAFSKNINWKAAEGRLR